jgi:ferrochelatase
MIESARAAFEKIPAERRQSAQLIFTAHSIPLAMAGGCRYEEQLREACRLVAEGLSDPLSLWERAGVRAPWTLVYQSRSGPPQQAWLGPDVNDFLRTRNQEAAIRDAVVVPIGFTSDHMEIIYDLDTEIRQLCEHLGINMVRAATVGTHPRFVRMIRELIAERISDSAPRMALGTLGPSHDICPIDCCRTSRN